VRFSLRLDYRRAEDSRHADPVGNSKAGPRGLYTGAFGWIAPDGDFRLNVAIRTLELAADHRGRLGIGSGIVADSEAAAEWQECLLKAAFCVIATPA
jgi:para-aminobenzoate synthetase/4-amino-4-deoxychorismate lyase